MHVASIGGQGIAGRLYTVARSTPTTVKLCDAIKPLHLEVAQAVLPIALNYLYGICYNTVDTSISHAVSLSCLFKPSNPILSQVLVSFAPARGSV